MIVYHLTVWTKPVDWAASSQKQTIGFYKTEAGAEAKIKELKKSKEWNVYYGDPQIWPVTVEE